MKYVVEQNISMWIHYSKYEIRICQGIEYIIPAQDAYPRPYNIQKKKEEIVLDAVNVGLLVLGKKSEQVIREAVLQFEKKYGLLGMMTALPVTPDFIEFPQTYFPKNRFIREKGLMTEEYMKKFFPFHDVEMVKKNLEPNWEDPDHTAFWSLLNGISDQPDAVRMSLQKEYSEPYEWVVNQLKDWAYMLSTTYLYYADGVVTDLEMNLTLQMGMEAFGGVAPSYIILLREKTTLWWHFNSLQQCIHMMLAFMLADEKNPLRLCKYCHKAFVMTEEDSWFCKSDCKDEFERKESLGK